MAITINHSTLTINIPQADLTSLGGSLYELDTEIKLRADVNALLDDEDGIVLEDAINHNTEVVLAGVTYARTIEFINGYTIAFSVEAAPYRVNLVGSNNNITDVLNLTDASVVPSNSAGLIAGQSEWTQAEKTNLIADLDVVKQIEEGRWQIVNNQMIFYDVDGVTPLRTFDLKDSAGNPVERGVFERVPA